MPSALTTEIRERLADLKRYQGRALPSNKFREYERVRDAFHKNAPTDIARLLDRVDELEKVIEGALRIEALWLPKSGFVDDPELVALASMYSNFTAAIQGASDE